MNGREQRYEISHVQTGAFLAIASAASPEAAIAALIAEPGYGYLTPSYLACKTLPPVQRVDAFGRELRCHGHDGQPGPFPVEPAPSRVSPRPPFPVRCQSGVDGRPQDHDAEGMLVGPDGEPKSCTLRQCHACAEVVIREYREKLGEEWTFQPFEPAPGSPDEAHRRRMIRRQIRHAGAKPVSDDLSGLQREAENLGLAPFRACCHRTLEGVCKLQHGHSGDHRFDAEAAAEAVAQAAETIRREPVSLDGMRRQRDELADALEALTRYVRPLVAYEGSELITGKALLEAADAALRKAGR